MTSILLNGKGDIGISRKIAMRVANLTHSLIANEVTDYTSKEVLDIITRGNKNIKGIHSKKPRKQIIWKNKYY